MNIKEILDVLDDRERFIIEKRFIEEWSQIDVAEALNVSQVKVSRLEKKALKKIRRGEN